MTHPTTSPEEYLVHTASESAKTRDAFLKKHAGDLVKAARLMSDCIKSGGKIMICGNGGSAADAQHMAAEMVGRMLIERRPLPAMSLTTDTSNLTAIGNDFSYDDVFAMQVRALGRKGDVLIAISTSGNSKNVIKAVEAASTQGVRVIVLTGQSGGKLKTLASDVFMCADAGTNSSRVQETHIFAYHSMVDLMDRFFAPT